MIITKKKKKKKGEREKKDWLAKYHYLGLASNESIIIVGKAHGKGREIGHVAEKEGHQPSEKRRLGNEKNLTKKRKKKCTITFLARLHFSMVMIRC
jgi:hypothetical protein